MSGAHPASAVIAALDARPARDVVLSDGAIALTAGAVRAHLAHWGDRLAALPPGAVVSRLDNGLPAAVLDLALAAAGRPHIAVPPFFTEAQAGHAMQAAVAVARAGEGTSNATCVDAVRLQPLPSTPPALPAGTALVTYTSGSTGTSRGVCLDRTLPESVAASLVAAMAPLDVRRHLCLLLLGVLLETIGGVYAPLLAGGEVRVPSLADVGHRGSAALAIDALLATLHRHQPESLIVVPQLLHALVAAAESGARLPTSLRMIAVGGARVPLSLLGRAAALRLPVYEGYGLSECASVVALNRPGAYRAGSVGRPLPHTAVRVADDGEVCVDGPRFLGYLGAASPPPGPWRTGDLGEWDGDGYLHLRGRRKAMYVTAWGRNVSPEWIEGELSQHPLIETAFVVGESRVQAAAVVVPRRPGTSRAALERAVAEVNAGLPDYAQVAAVIPADEPFSTANGLLTGNGRPRREALFQRYGVALGAAPDPLANAHLSRTETLPS